MPKFEDLTGQKFGRLTVVERAEDRITDKRRYIRWDCSCDCGTKHVIVTTSSLKSGNSKSCGCLQKEKVHDMFFKDITGQKFGRLTVVERVENKGKRVMWRCICDCGNYCVVRGENLRNGSTMSCGCLQREMSVCTYKEETGNKYGFLTVIKNIGKDKDGENLWECQCDCGNKTIVSGSSLRSGHTVSCGCFQKKKVSQINTKNEIGNIYGKLTVIEHMGFKNNKAIWKCKCECGNECIVKGINLRYGDTLSCGCLNSKGETIIKTILNERNINYIPQKTFNDCRDIKPLPFDFYLPDYNICIEYDGIQHFEPVDLFGGIEAFKITKKHDDIKNLYCQQNGILLLRVKYNQDIFTVIDTFLNEIQRGNMVGKVKLVMLCGLPASGKSTYCEQYKNNKDWIVLSRDEIRAELSSVNDQSQNELVFNTLHKRIKEDLLNGKNVIYDATNLSRKRRIHFLSNELRYVPCQKVCVLFATPYEICQKNNAARDRKVPEHVLERMIKNFETPCLQEGWDDIQIVWWNYTHNETEYNYIKDLCKWRSISQDNPHHKLSIGDHMLAAEDYYAEMDVEHLPIIYDIIIMHDCGKVFCKAFIDSKGNPCESAHYYQHHNVSAYNSLFYLKELDIYNDEEILYGSLLINLHMRPFLSWKQSDKTKEKDRRLFGDDIVKNIEIIHECDLAAH